MTRVMPDTSVYSATRNEAELAEFLSSPRRNASPNQCCLVAASARQHGLQVLTADAHFLKIPQVLAQHAHHTGHSK